MLKSSLRSLACLNQNKRHLDRLDILGMNLIKEKNMAFTTNQSAVAELYIAALGRSPEMAGLNYWVGRLESTGSDALTLTQIQAAFFDNNIAEVAARFPAGTTAAQYVEAIYVNVFGRASDSEGSAFWSAKIATDGADSVMAQMLTIAKDPVNSVDKAYLESKIATANNAYDVEVDAVTNVGETFTLTTGTTPADTIIGTAKNDTITAASGTLEGTDIIIDQSSTDNDTLNVTYKTADMTLTPTISKIENINVTIDAFAGTTTTFAATNVTGATITLGSTKLGYDGAAGVTAAAANNVTAGTNVTTLTVAGLTTGTVNAGSATTANITSAAATDTVNVKVNGNVALNTTTGTKAAITTTAASDIDYNSAAGTTLTTVAGTSNNILSMARADVVSTHTVTNNSTGTLTLSVTDSGAFDATKFDVDSIVLEGGTTNAATIATGASITTAVIQDTLSIVGANATAATNTVTLTTSKNLTTSTTFTDIATANIVATANITIDDLVSTTQDVNLSGTANVTVTTTDAAKLDASALVGILTLDVTTADSEVLGGSGNNVITFGEFDSSFVGKDGNDTITVAATSSFAIQTGNGVNTIDAKTLSTGTLAVTGGTGIDTVKFDFTIAAATVAMNGGAGNDIILVGDGLASTTDLNSAATWAVESFEVLAIKDAAASSVINQTVTLKGSQMAGFTSAVIQGPATGTSDDTFAIGVTADTATTDLSALVIGSVAKTTVTITGAVTADTIKATNGNDVIITSGGADVIDISQGGSDTITIAEGESASTAMVSITGFNITDSTSASDKLNLDATTASADTVTGGALDVKAAIASGTGSETVTVSINASGIATLGGADAAAIDTLAEWIAVMKTDGVLFTTTGDDNSTGGAEAMTSAAFQFGGNTYVVSAVDADTTAGTSDVTFDIIELVGVTGADALATSAGSYDIVLA